MSEPPFTSDTPYQTATIPIPPRKPSLADMLFGTSFRTAISLCVGALLLTSSLFGMYQVLKPKPASNQRVRWQSASTDCTTAGGVTVAGGMVYLGCDNGMIYALEAADGKQLWSFQAQGRVFARPTVVDGVVYVGTESALVYALRATDGTKMWSTQAGARIDNSPVVSDNLLLVSGGDRYLYALALSNRQIRWKFALENSYTTQPVVANGVVYISSNAKRFYALDVTTGKPRWSLALNGAFYSTLAISGDSLYLHTDTGILYMLRASDGHILGQTNTGSAVSSAPAIDGAYVYTTIGTHSFGAYNTTDPSHWILWQKDIGGHTGGATISAKSLYIAVGDTLYAITPAEGITQWRYTAATRFQGLPQLSDGVLYIANVGGTVYALNA